MKCPICGNELELRNKQIGTNENGDPVFNQYAICRDCRKQWNLDKQKAKKAAAKKQEIPTKQEPVKQESPDKKSADIQKTSSENRPVKEGDAAKRPVRKQSAAKKPAAPVSGGSRAKDGEKAAVRRKKSPEKTQNGTERKETAAKRRPRPETDTSAPAKKPVKRRRPETAPADEEKRYSNIPPEKVRNKREKAARKGYEDMLATGSIDSDAVRKKRKRFEDDADKNRKASSVKSSPDRRNAAKASPKKPEPEADEYDDDEYYDDEPRFRAMRIILGIISLAGFGYFIYRGFITGLADTTEGGGVSSGTTFIVLALCMLVSALLYFIMQRKNTVFAFLLPMVFYLGGAVFAFIQRGDDLQLLIAAVAGAVLAVISLILAITSRGGGYDEDDYDEAFDDDYADDYED